MKFGHTHPCAPPKSLPVGRQGKVDLRNNLEILKLPCRLYPRIYNKIMKLNFENLRVPGPG
jgi:hypothetical protein